MALYTKKEFAGGCGISTKNLAVYIQRKKVIVGTDGMISSDVYENISFLQKHKNSNHINIIQLEKERLEWSLQTFPEATPQSSLEKLKSEIKEVEQNINDGERDAEEYADCLMCLFDSAGRQGITPEIIFQAFQKKLAKNKSRVWAKNPDNSYSHVK